MQLCERRLELAGSGGGGDVARRGCVIEAAQVLTTHNLAVLVDGLGLRPRLQPLAGDLAAQAFGWTLARELPPPTQWRARLRLVKNVAHAWRQAIFWLSLCERDEGARVLAHVETLLDAGSAWSHRMRAPHLGLRAVLEGESPGRPLLGWTLGPHWLLA